jgi:hypothetical protein
MAKEEILIDLKIDQAQSARNLDEVAKSTRELEKAKRQLDFRTEEGRKAILLANEQLNKNNAIIKENASALNKQRMNVGNYTDSILQAVPGLGKFSGGINGLNMAFKANPIGLVITALVALKGIFSQNAVVADKLSFIFEGFNKGLQSIIDSIVTTVSSLDNLKAAFLNPIDTITSFFSKTKQAAVAGYEAAEAADAFGAAQARAAQQIKIADIQITSLEKSLKDRTKNEQERIAIANQIADMEIANSERRAKIASDELANEQLRLKGKTLSGEEETRLVELETVVFEANEEKKIAAATRSTRINILLAKEEASLKSDNARTARELEQAESDFRVQLLREENEQKKQVLQELQDWINANNEAAEVAEIRRRDAEFERTVQEMQQNQEWQQEKTEADEIINEQWINGILNRKKQEEQFAKETAEREKALYQNRFQIASGFFASITQLLGKNTAEGKAAAVLSIASSTAEGIAKATAAGAGLIFPKNIVAILSGITAVLSGAAQAKSVLGFERGGLLKFNNGGVLNGPSHANGGIPFSVGGRLGFEAEGGETIINKKSSAMFRPMLSAINVAGGGVQFAEGGVLGFPSSAIDSFANPGFDISRLESFIANLKVQVAVEDINDGQKNYAEITDRAQF